MKSVCCADKPLEYFAFAKMELSISLVPPSYVTSSCIQDFSYRDELFNANLADLIEVS